MPQDGHLHRKVVNLSSIFCCSTQCTAAHCQLYDSLLNVKRQHGIKTPYGMLSTYTRFQICWLDAEEGSKEERTLQTSQIFDLHDPDHKYILLVLLTAMKAGYNAPKMMPLESEGAPAFYSKFTSHGIDHTSAIMPQLSLEWFPTLPTTQSDIQLFIHHHFALSAEGRASRVFDSTGAQAVVKTYSPIFRRKACKDSTFRLAIALDDSNQRNLQLCQKEAKF